MTALATAPQAKTQPSTEASHPHMTISATELSPLRYDVAGIATIDPDFRAALIAEPLTTINQLVALNSGGSHTLSKNMEVIIVEDTATTMHVVIPSPDKAQGHNDELSKLSRALESSPELQAALESSPRETLQRYLESINGKDIELPTDRAIRVIREGAGELVIVTPPDTKKSAGEISASELKEPLHLEPHMSCFTCQCFTNGPCFTGSCFTASGCFSYSGDCR